MNSLAESIEQFLLETREWVSTPELCSRFGINERQLRDVDDRPGLISNFAISRPGPGGFKHATLASPSEYIRWKHGLRKHAIKELVRVASVERLRNSRTTKNTTHIFEQSTGQELMPFFTS